MIRRRPRWRGDPSAKIVPPAGAPSQLKRRSETRIVYFGGDVKSWMQSLPSVCAARPSHCPGCGAAGAPIGGPLGLHGHGVRERTVLGPVRLCDGPATHRVLGRRYACQRCGAVVVVVPAAVLPRVRYGAVAIALSLGLWSSAGDPGWRVREQVSPLGSAGNERLHGWRCLRRWARRASGIWRTVRAGPAVAAARAAALEITRQLAARAPMPTGQLVHDACQGALFA